MRKEYPEGQASAMRLSHDSVRGMHPIQQAARIANVHAFLGMQTNGFELRHQPQLQMRMKRTKLPMILTTAGLGLATFTGLASSHREAPLISAMPKLDCTDFYAFNSYESGRSNYVTFIANYIPLQDGYGGPNYFTMATNAVYEIHIDNNGDAVEDITFQFSFSQKYNGIKLPIGPEGNRRTNAIPLIIAGQVTKENTSAINVQEQYTIVMLQGPRREPMVWFPVFNPRTGGLDFDKPLDNIGNKTIPDYDGYANQYVYEFAVPGCSEKGRVFVGQRKDPFVVNLGEIFDLINISTSPLGPVDANKDKLEDKNVTAICLELPKSCLLAGDKTTIGAWSTSSTVAGGKFTQVSRLGMPLVNEVVIGLPDKDKFNASEPKNDLQFVDYVTHPTLPAVIELLFSAAGAKAPEAPRSDLVAAFATGITGLNANGSLGEMQRLNTAIPAKPAADQKNLGALAGDIAGFPNGRRPGDDVVDIELRVAMGALVPGAPNQSVPFTDGAYVDATFFDEKFPYLRSPLKGSPNDPTITILLKSAAKVGGPFQNAFGAKWDEGTQTLSADKPSTAEGYYKLQADGKVAVDSIKLEGDKVKLGLK